MKVPVALGDRRYDIVVDESYDGLGDLLRGRRRVAVVTETAIDDHVGSLVAGVLDGTGIAHATFTIGDGEDAKSLATVAEQIAEPVVRLVDHDVVAAVAERDGHLHDCSANASSTAAATMFTARSSVSTIASAAAA